MDPDLAGSLVGLDLAVGEVKLVDLARLFVRRLDLDLPHELVLHHVAVPHLQAHGGRLLAAMTAIAATATKQSCHSGTVKAASHMRVFIVMCTYVNRVTCRNDAI